jgi:hypothetical protein
MIMDGVPAGRLTASAGVSSTELDSDTTNNFATDFEDIPSVPALRIQPDAVGNYQVMWSGNDIRWILQATSSEGGTNAPTWQNIIPDNIQVQDDGTRYYVAPTEAAEIQLFRLMFQMP